MYESVLMAGFGGQGIMSMGMLLAYGGMLEDKEVTWMPAYGPEMRGGTANCTVIISSEPIASPVLKNPLTLIAMNLPSLEKFSDCVRKGGLILYNSSLIPKEPDRQDVTVLAVPANEIAKDLGETKVMNMIILGAYLKLKPILRIESIKESLKKVLSRRKNHLIQVNMEALKRGASLVKEGLESLRGEAR